MTFSGDRRPTDPEPSPATSDLEEAVSVFVQHRKRLFGIAYRVLGSAAEAEDVVQEVWLRWQRTDRSVVISPVAFLSSTTTRLAINVAQSARVRRETYIGPWLPEPVDTSSDPELGAQRAEALELAMLLVLERLSPTERAAYVLREAFDYAYPEIAAILRLSLVNVRKIVSRARKHLSEEQRGSVDTAEHRRLLDVFVAAARTGDVASLEALLTPDTVSLSDGNGMRGCARIPVRGRSRGGQDGDVHQALAGRGAPVRRRQRQYGGADQPGGRARRVPDRGGLARGHPPVDVGVQPEQDRRVPRLPYPLRAPPPCVRRLHMIAEAADGEEHMVSVTGHSIEVTAESLRGELARLRIQKQALERELAAVVAHLGSVQRALGVLQPLLLDNPADGAGRRTDSAATTDIDIDIDIEPNDTEPTDTDSTADADAQGQKSYGRLTEQIMEYFAGVGDAEVRARDVAAALGRDTDSGSINGVRSTLDRLVGASRVQRAGRGLYRAGRP